MKAKKAMIALTVVLAVGQIPMTAMAHGGCHKARTVTYSMCNVEECCTTTVHEHDGTYYCGHYFGDGHDYHEVCSVEGCTVAAAHEHDGITCLPHCANDGHSYHNTGHCGKRRCH